MAFDPQPALEGELLRVRPLRAADFDALYAVANDPLLWNQHPEDRSDSAAFTAYFADQLASGGGLAVVERATGDLAGSTRYHGYSAERSEVEIGWTFLARRCWGGPHNAELKRLMLEHAFGFVERVVFLVDDHNLRSRRAVEKLGAIERNARRRGMVLYEITRADWARRRAPSLGEVQRGRPAPTPNNRRFGRDSKPGRFNAGDP
jgi:RimJ/RimL family protein N-acetyltransferase